MGRRHRRRAHQDSEPLASGTSDYRDAEGNVLTLRDGLSRGTIVKLGELSGPAAASGEDLWQRRSELLFERLAVSWTIAGLPLTREKELLGRYRMADSVTRSWVRETLDEHVHRRLPELAGP